MPPEASMAGTVVCVLGYLALGVGIVCLCCWKEVAASVRAFVLTLYGRTEER